MNKRHEARQLALKYLYAWEFSKNNKMEFLDEFPCLDEEEILQISDENTLYAKLLLQGVLENLEELDALIIKYSTNRPIERIGIITKNILRLSIFSLLYNKEVHPSIIIDEAVKLSIEFSDDVTFKFVNGILDTIKKQEV